MKYSIYIDFSTLNTWRSCPTKFIQGVLEPQVASPAMVFGTTFHKFAQLCWTQKTLILPENVPQELVGLTGRYSKTHLQKLLTAYFITRINETPLELVKEEVFGCVKLYESPSLDIYFQGFMDLFLKNSKNEFVFREIKTTGLSAFEFTETAFVMDQVIGYYWLIQNDPQLEEFRENFKRAQLDYVCTSTWDVSDKTNREIGTFQKNPAASFALIDVFVNKQHLTAWKANVIKDTLRLFEDIQTQSFSRRAPSACRDFRKTCEFIGKCNEFEQPSVDVIELQFPWKGFKITKGESNI